jgi:hypothetical protein
MNYEHQKICWKEDMAKVLGDDGIEVAILHINTPSQQRICAVVGREVT